VADAQPGVLLDQQATARAQGAGPREDPALGVGEVGQQVAGVDEVGGRRVVDGEVRLQELGLGNGRLGLVQERGRGVDADRALGAGGGADQLGGGTGAASEVEGDGGVGEGVADQEAAAARLERGVQQAQPVGGQLGVAEAVGGG
jgi:hypothetical protein